MLMTTSQLLDVCVPLQYTHASFLIALPRSNLVWLPPLAPAYREDVVILE